MKFPIDLLVATTNNGKIREFADLLGALPFRIRGLREFANLPDVAETGATFAENADLKAATRAREIGLWTLADDSGLEVAALGNAPGVFSARYGGAQLSDAERSTKLLRELDKTGDRARRARFVAVISLADPTGAIVHTARGVCDGTISVKPMGNNGFGYDPIFVPDGFAQTFGELSSEIKGEISHRSRASREIMRFLQHFFNI